MTAYRGVVVADAREWLCGHRHRGERAAFDCACREVRRRVNRLLHGAPRKPLFAQFSMYTREAGNA